MGWDHSLICMDCKEILSNVARNQHLYRDKESINNLEKFLIKHGDHNLLFEADDEYSRCPGGTYWKEESENTKENKNLSVKYLYKCPVCCGRGFVDANFYSCFSSNSSGSPEKCRSCDGKGYIVV